MLYMYSTTYENAAMIDRCMKSIAPLNPEKIFVVDNCSSDDSINILKKYKNVVAVQKKCTKGEGRGLAMDMALKVAKDDDIIAYIELDQVYKPKYIELVKHLIKTIKHGEVFTIGMLSTAKTNRNLPWSTLNFGEDIERAAHATYNGVKWVHSDVLNEINDAYANPYFDNESNAGLTANLREKRYTHSGVGYLMRMFTRVMEEQRGGAYKSFESFYAICRAKSTFNFVAFWLGYHTANLLGTYSYDDKLSNPEFIRSKFVRGK